jgi:AraC-like DNA-binding protein
VSASLGRIAESLFMTPRTLQRKLAKENTNFQHLLDEVRANPSVELLLQTDKSIEQIGNRLGFYDTAAFSKAFKRWKGVAPKLYRKQKKANPV